MNREYDLAEDLNLLARSRFKDTARILCDYITLIPGLQTGYTPAPRYAVVMGKREIELWFSPASNEEAGAHQIMRAPDAVKLAAQDLPAFVPQE